MTFVRTPATGTGRDALATTIKLHEGLSAMASGDATTALACFEDALAQDPGSALAAYHRVLALARLGRDAAALEAAREVLRAHPDHDALAALVVRLEQRVAIAAEGDTTEPAGTSEEAPPWRLGELVAGRWDVFGSVQGGMGRVYFVRDREWNGMELAVKTLTLRPGANAREVERTRALFRRETQVWLDLGAHPHIVSGFYTLEVQGALRFFMEYVPGLPLDAVLRRAGGKLAIANALDLAIQLAAGVGYVHARGVVHRDIKAGNCLIMPDGALRVTDFGLGKLASERDAPAALGAGEPFSAASLAARSTGGLGASPPGGGFAPATPGLSIGGAGTPWYMSPEQWRSLGEAREPADVYAVGVLLYELFAGCYPFDTTPEALERLAGRVPPRLERLLSVGASRELLLWLLHLEAEPPPLTACNPEVPAALDRLARACLDKSPERRPTIDTVRAELLDAYASVTGRPYPRELPGALRPTEAGENNRAVSYFVMGEVDRARAILDEWLAAHPTALYPWINRRVMAIRLGESTPQRLALEFARALRPAHVTALETDRHVTDFAVRLRRVAPWTEGAVTTVAVSPDSATLALAVGDAVVLVRASDGARLRTLEGHTAAVAALAFSPDGRWLASGSYDKTARLWAVDTGALARTLEGHRDCVTSVAFSPDGRRVVTGGGASYKRADRTARVWDAHSGRALATLRGHRGGVTAVAFAPDGAHVATGCVDGSAGLWDTARGELVYSFEREDGAAREPLTRAESDAAVARPDAVAAVGFSADGRTLVTAHGDGRVSRWSTRSGQLVAESRRATRGELTCAAVSPDGAVVAVGDARGEARRWTPGEPLPRRAVVTGAGRLSAVAFAPDGTTLVTAGEEGCQVWDLSRGSTTSGAAEPPARERDWPLLITPPVSAQGLLHQARTREQLSARLEGGDLGALRPLQALRAATPELARDAPLLAQLHRAARGRGCAVSVRDAWVVRALPPGAGVQAVAFSPDGAVLRGAASGHAGVSARAWDAATGADEEVVLGAGGETAAAIAFGPDPRVLLVAGTNGGLALRRTRSGAVARRLAEQGPRATALALSADGALALAGDADGTARLWDAARGELLRTLRGHRYEVTAAAFSPDGRHVLTGSWDKTARIWEVSSGRVVHVLEGHRAGVTAVAYAPDGRRAVTTSDDGARVWSCADGALSAVFDGHTAGVTTAAFSPDGRFVATGAWDDTARVWRAGDGAAVRALAGRGYGVTAVAFSPDGLHLAAGSMDGVVRLWVLDLEWDLLPDLLADAEALATAPAGSRASRAWPRAARLDADVDAWLDVWSDLDRVARGGAASRDEQDRLRAVRREVALQLGALVHGAAGSEPHRAASEALLARARAVDPALADALRAALAH